MAKLTARKDVPCPTKVTLGLPPAAVHYATC